MCSAAPSALARQLRTCDSLPILRSVELLGARSVATGHVTCKTQRKKMHLSVQRSVQRDFFVSVASLLSLRSVPVFHVSSVLVSLFLNLSADWPGSVACGLRLSLQEQILPIHVSCSRVAPKSPSWGACSRLSSAPPPRRAGSMHVYPDHLHACTFLFSDNVSFAQCDFFVSVASPLSLRSVPRLPCFLRPSLFLNLSAEWPGSVACGLRLSFQEQILPIHVSCFRVAPKNLRLGEPVRD